MCFDSVQESMLGCFEEYSRQLKLGSPEPVVTEKQPDSVVEENEKEH